MNNLIRDLNKEQREAVVFGNGPLLIIAGAGTGKFPWLQFTNPLPNGIFEANIFSIFRILQDEDNISLQVKADKRKAA